MERQTATDGDLLVEDADRLRGGKAKLAKDPFGLLFCLRFNAWVDDCCFHGAIASHSQHRCKMFSVLQAIIYKYFSSLCDAIFIQHRAERRAYGRQA